jgi:hypothetical protein
MDHWEKEEKKSLEKLEMAFQFIKELNYNKI